LVLGKQQYNSRMKKINKKLSEIFNVDPIEEDEVVKTEIIVSPDQSSAIDVDTDFARKNIKDLILKGNSAIDELLLVAKQSEHPRAYEVAASLIKNLSDLNKDLLEVQKRKIDLSGSKSNGKDSVNIDKAVFVGSTAELMKLIKSSKDENGNTN